MAAPIGSSPAPGWAFAGGSAAATERQQYSPSAGSSASTVLSLSSASTAAELASDSESTEQLRVMILAMHGGVMPIISLTGVVVNAINIAVLAGIMRRYKTPVYRVLLAIAIADLLLMAVLFVHGARFSMRERPITRSDEVDLLDAPSYFFWHTWDTFANVCGMASNWCVLMVVSLRLVAVYFPLRAPTARERLGVVVALPIVFVIAVVVNLPWALVKPYDGASGRFVLRAEQHQTYKRGYYVVLLLLYHVIPWIAMAALAGLLLFAMWSKGKRSGGSGGDGGGAGGGGGGLGTKLEKRKKEAQQMLSATLAGKAAWFIASTLPIVTYYFMLFAVDDEEALASRQSMRTFYNVAHVLALTNYVANFFLFTFLNHAYRRQLLSLVCRRRPGTTAEEGDAGERGSNPGWSTALATNVTGSVEQQPLTN